MIKDFLIETAIPFIISFLNKNPNTAPIIVVLITIQGFCRLWLKPLMTAIVNFTNWTETPKDNEFIAKILDSKAYKAFSFVIDWFLSIKLPQKEKNENTNNNSNELANRINQL
mgnify:CR=1 FL=1